MNEINLSIQDAAYLLLDLIMENTGNHQDYKQTRKNYWKTVELKTFLAEKFGKSYGWSVSKSRFKLETLAGNKRSGGRTYIEEYHQFFDHPYFYKYQNRAAGIAVHLYNHPSHEDLEDLTALCDRFNLSVEYLPNVVSWWYPERTKLYLYTSRNPEFKNLIKGSVNE